MKRWTQRPEGSSWGDFGEDDQKGKINLVTPEIRLKAAEQIKTGISFCLSLPLDYPGGNALITSRQAPKLFTVRRESGQMNYNFPWRAMTCQHDHLDVTCDDAVTLFTQYSTQWDALCHYGQFFDADGDGLGEMVYYNGFRAEEHIVSPAEGSDEPRAKALGIQNLAETCAQGRGVLVNLHAVLGRDHVSVGFDDLMTIMERQGVTVAKGDFLCLYTGFDEVLLGMQKDPDPKVLHGVCSGLDGGDPRLQQWISESGVVGVIADNTAVELLPSKRRGTGPRALLPLHAHCLFKQGIHLGELWYLRDLAAWLAANKRSHFFLTAPPLRLPGSAGSPLTPVATV